jgi:hypothetical protein
VANGPQSELVSGVNYSFPPGVLIVARQPGRLLAACLPGRVPTRAVIRGLAKELHSNVSILTKLAAEIKP